jgi:hypothetical protein
VFKIIAEETAVLLLSWLRLLIYGPLYAASFPSTTVGGVNCYQDVTTRYMYMQEDKTSRKKKLLHCIDIYGENNLKSNNHLQATQKHLRVT